MRGLVFDINEFAVHDGPGIRTAVFLKGCPLRCLWCHNPEGLSPRQEIFKGRSACIQCGRCQAVCAHESCTACGACIAACPRNLRRLAAEEWESETLALHILKNRDILARGGGVTFSGGEPLTQADFVFDVIRRVKPLHTAIETCGHVPEAVFQTAVESADLLLMGRKHADSAVHEQYTGFGTELIEKNLAFLLASGRPSILRVPVIPGFNDTEEAMRALAESAAGHPGVIRAELLAFNNLAGAKYELLGKPYPFDPKAAPKSPEQFRHIFEEMGMRVFVP